MAAGRICRCRTDAVRHSTFLQIEVRMVIICLECQKMMGGVRVGLGLHVLKCYLSCLELGNLACLRAWLNAWI